MHLFLASFDLHLIKEDGPPLQGLTPSIKNNSALIEQSSHSVPLGDEDLKCHTCNQQILSLEKKKKKKKTPLEEPSSITLESLLSGTANQSLCHQT